MGQILLARIDDRLVHGQVITRWATGRGCNAIFVVDDLLARDQLMKNVYSMTGKASGLLVKVMSVNEAAENWEKDGFGNHKVIMLFKTVDIVREVVKKGLPIKEINVGGLARKADSIPVIPSASLTRPEMEVLKELHETYHVEIFFQTLPDTKTVSLDRALELFK